MKIEYMREYIELLNNLNFTDTANKLFLTQPALSRHIFSIEQEIGIQLLIRTKHKVSPTATGILVSDEFQKIITQYDQLLEKTNLFSSGMMGEIKIGMLNYAMDKYYNPLMRFCGKEFPYIRLSLSACQDNQIIPSLLDDKIDIGHVFNTHLSDSEKIGVSKIGEEKLAIMVLNNHALAKKNSIVFSDIINETIIIFPYEGQFSEDLKKILIGYGVNSKQFIYADKSEQIDTLPFLLQETNGIAFLPNHIKNMQRSNVTFVDLNSNEFSINSYFIYKKSNDNPAISLLLKRLDEIYNYTIIKPSR